MGVYPAWHPWGVKVLVGFRLLHGLGESDGIACHADMQEGMPAGVPGALLTIIVMAQVFGMRATWYRPASAASGWS